MKEILILAGPSAVGKTTVATELLQGEIPFGFLRSVTTRAPRGDAYDAEYIYLSEDEFRALVASGGVLEYTEYAGAFYGTPRSEIDRVLALGKYPLLILDLKGVKSLHECAGDISACALYVWDAIEVMDKRLEERYLGASASEDNLSRLCSRKAQNRKDYAEIASYACHFYAFVENSQEISATAEAVKNAFKGFLSGEVRDGECVERTSRRLSASVQG